MYSKLICLVFFDYQISNNTHHPYNKYYPQVGKNFLVQNILPDGVLYMVFLETLNLKEYKAIILQFLLKVQTE